jgi:uncharacterized membrane protein YczE
MKINKNHITRALIYLLGIIVTGLGINVLLRSALGAGAWDTVIYNLRSFFSNILSINATLGTVSFIIYVTILAIVIIYYKKLKYLFVFIPIFGISLAIDFWDLVVFSSYYPSEIWLKAIFYVLGTFILTLGLALIIFTKYPAMVFDELTIMMMKLLKINSFFKTRILIELFAIVTATLFGFLSNIGFGAVNFGSFILALIIGPMIEFQLRTLNKYFKRIE